MRTLHLLATVSVIALTSVAAIGTASATSTNYNWKWTDDADTSGSTVKAGNTLTDTNNGQTLTAEAFQLTANGNASAGSAKLSTALSTARLFNYSGTGYGLGVTDTAEGGSTNPNTKSGDTSSPNHTVSNAKSTNGTQVTDLIAFQLPTTSTTSFSVTSIVLNEFGNDVSPKGHADASVLIGGNSTTTLASLAGLSITQLEAEGFHLLQFDGTGANTSGGSRTITSTTTDTNDGKTLADYTGSILIVAASLNDGTSNPDYFKPASIAGSSSPITPTKVPEPGTLAMFGAGLAALAALRRRYRKRA